MSADQGLPESQPRTRPVAKILIGLGLVLLVLLPFGSFGLLIAGIPGWFLWTELAALPPVLLAAALFLSADGGVASRLRPALLWSGVAVLAAAILLIPFVAAGRTPAEGMDPLVPIADAAAFVALMLVALAAWQGWPERRLGPLLALVVLTSRLVVYPAVALLGVAAGIVNASFETLFVIPFLLIGIAIGMLGVLLPAALLAWGAMTLRRHLAPGKAIAALAGAALLLRFALLAA